MSAAAQLEERIEKCRKILSDNPRSQIFAALGEAYRKKGDLERAYAVTKQGLENHPDYGPAHIVMAKIYMEKKLYHEAEKELEFSVKLDGKTRATEKLLAEVWLKRGELDKAQDTLVRLKETGPEEEGITNLLNLARNLRERPQFNTRENSVKTAHRPSVVEKYRPLDEPVAPAQALAGDEIYYSWAQIVDAVKSFPLVQGTLVIGPDGWVVENRAISQISPEIIGPLCLSIVDTAAQNLPRIDFGRLSQLLIETMTVKIWIWSIKGHYLIIWADPEVNLGSLKMRVSQIVEHIEF
jgi:predicted regulator of Ras-like GTPase activity (Roadblock/LC7/MglB family)